MVENCCEGEPENGQPVELRVPDSPLVSRIQAASNFEPRRNGLRPTILLMHYTGMPLCEKAIDWLSRPESKVSCHYVIDTEGSVTQMVSEELRAWHAGVSVWCGERDINSASIGIEIHNPGHGDDYHDFPDRQMQATTELSREIIGRWGIAAEKVLGHSDVSPGRKVDPGEKFDWAGLAAAGVGRWVEPEPLGPLIGTHSRQADADEISDVQRLLTRYGYGVEANGRLDADCREVISAFQRHFRPQRVDGVIDASTAATLRRLIEASDLPLTS